MSYSLISKLWEDRSRPGTTLGLEQLAGATVHEASGGRGALPAAIKPVYPRARVLGPAFTVDCPAGDNLWLHRAIYAATPGDVLVAHVRGVPEAGYWGEIMTCAAIQSSVAGLVISGGVRDVERISTLGFPVFATTVCVRRTTKTARDGALGVPVRIGDVLISPGDAVLGDADGVVIVPAGEVEAVSAAARASGA